MDIIIEANADKEYKLIDGQKITLQRLFTRRK